MPLIGVVTGMKSEVAALRVAWRGTAFAFFAAGGSAGRAEEGARSLVRQGAAVLVSAGLAGGLDPALKCGDVLLANEVVAPDGRSYLADGDWHARLMARLSVATRWSDLPVLGVDAAVRTPGEKTALYLMSRAASVDMESHGVARAAAALKVPLIVLRVIADPADRAIPQAAIAGMAADGSTRALPVLARLALRPREIPAVARLACDSRAAHAALGRVALAVGGVLVG